MSASVCTRSMPGYHCRAGVRGLIVRGSLSMALVSMRCCWPASERWSCRSNTYSVALKTDHRLYVSYLYFVYDIIIIIIIGHCVPVTSPNADRLSAAESLLKIPSHIDCVATVPCEIFDDICLVYVWFTLVYLWLLAVAESYELTYFLLNASTVFVFIQ